MAAQGYNGRGLNGYQKRLVHQLVRAEFPDVVSLSKQDFVQLIPFDQEREDAQLQRKMAWFGNNLARQIGARWLAEAICSNVDEILPEKCVPPFASGDLEALATLTYPSVDMTTEEREAHVLGFTELCNTLNENRTVLVGHNLFLDLIYFYTLFFGPLPDRVEGFQKIIAQLFPLVVDTKYLADKINDNSPLYNSSLQDIDRELSKLPVPMIGLISWPGSEEAQIRNTDRGVQKRLLSTANISRARHFTKQVLTASPPRKCSSVSPLESKRPQKERTLHHQRTKSITQRQKTAEHLPTPTSC